MATAPVEQQGDAPAFLSAVHAELREFANDFAARFLLLGGNEVAETVDGIEALSRIVEHLQVLGAHAVQSLGLASTGERTEWPTPSIGTTGSASITGIAGMAHPTSLASTVSTVSTVTFVDPESSATLTDTVSPATLADPVGSATLTDAVSSATLAGHASPLEGTGSHREFRNTADFLRARLRISRSEANRRLRLAESTRPRLLLGGQTAAAPLEVLGEAFGAGKVSGRAASLIRDAMERVRPVAESRELDAMERHLTRQATESDEDILRVVARRWESTLDQDGQEPSEKLLRARQGVFLRGRRNGLHYLEIGATDEQFEHLATAMNATTNPRSRAATRKVDSEHSSGAAMASQWSSLQAEVISGTDGTPTHTHGEDGDSGNTGSTTSAPGLDDGSTRAQQLLEGLVGACRIALAGDGLPAAGGHRPQVMVTIDYRTLLGELGQAGDAVFAEQISARSIRRLACDADLLPLVLGGKGQILDVGRSQRLFPPHLRRALVARDKGCAFPDCAIPATWCEAHHIVPWEKGGTTKLSDGVLLCSRHHHLIHEGSWTVRSRHGIPWFLPPHHLDPGQKLRRNGYWSAGDSTKAAQLQLE